LNPFYIDTRYPVHWPANYDRKVAVKADTTLKDYPATIDLKNVYNEPGVPVTILLIPGQQEPTRFRGITFGDDLKSALEKLPLK
jgi:hypothetical protein